MEKCLENFEKVAGPFLDPICSRQNLEEKIRGFPARYEELER